VDDDPPPPSDRGPELPPARRLATKMGVGVFLFFLAKGLLWLIGPALLAWWASR
jgi:hypothetical protein